MNKKTGIVVAVIAGVLVLCCLGGFFFMKYFTDRFQATIEKDKAFVKTALTDTAKDWDEGAFSMYADSAFNTPERRAQTKKQFALLKGKLGSLVSLGEITSPGRRAFTSTKDGDEVVFSVKFVAPAKFEKGNGVFDVTVKNSRGRQAISEIAINPENAKVEVGSNNTSK